MSSRCRSCEADIEWVITEAGRKMPIDAEPAEGGNVLMLASAAGPVARVLDPVAAARTSGVLYRPHFVTCPQAGEWRRERAGAEQ